VNRKGGSPGKERDANKSTPLERKVSLRFDLEDQALGKRGKKKGEKTINLEKSSQKPGGFLIQTKRDYKTDGTC